MPPWTLQSRANHREETIVTGVAGKFCTRDSTAAVPDCCNWVGMCWGPRGLAGGFTAQGSSRRVLSSLFPFTSHVPRAQKKAYCILKPVQGPHTTSTIGGLQLPSASWTSSSRLPTSAGRPGSCSGGLKRHSDSQQGLKPSTQLRGM